MPAIQTGTDARATQAQVRNLTAQQKEELARKLLALLKREARHERERVGSKRR